MSNWSISTKPTFRISENQPALSSGNPGFPTHFIGTNGTTAANTKTIWYEMVTSMPFNCEGFRLSMTPFQYNGQTDTWLVDIAIGAAGSERVIVTDLFVDGSRCDHVVIPIAIKSGTRVAVRQQSLAGSDQMGFTITPLGSTPFGNYGFCRTQTGGMSEATSLPVLVDPGGSANTKGAWVQLISSTTFHIKQIWLMWHTYSTFSNAGTDANALTVDTSWLVDIGVGGAGSEVVIIPNVSHYQGAFAHDYQPGIMRFNVDISSGKRIAARALSNSNDAHNRTLWAGILVFG